MLYHVDAVGGGLPHAGEQHEVELLEQVQGEVHVGVLEEGDGYGPHARQRVHQRLERDAAQRLELQRHGQFQIMGKGLLMCSVCDCQSSLLNHCLFLEVLVNY